MPTFLSVITFAPVVVGWVLAGYFTLRAFGHLRVAKPGERLFTLFFGEYGIALYSPEGHRYRLLAFLSFLGGLVLTLILGFTFGSL